MWAGLGGAENRSRDRRAECYVNTLPRRSKHPLLSRTQPLDFRIVGLDATPARPLATR